MTGAKIKQSVVTGAKVKDQSLGGQDIDVTTLGAVPSAQTANSIVPPEPVHLVGNPGEPGFENGSSNAGFKGSITLAPVGFYKDREGAVHLQGYANVDVGPAFVSVFTLPPGYRPAATGIARVFEQQKDLITYIGGDGRVMAREVGGAALEGISFRAES